MVERWGGRIADILRTHHFKDGEALEKTIDRYVWLYNDPLPLPALGARSPFQAMKEVDEKDHGLFHKRPYDHPGLDTYQAIDTEDLDAMIQHLEFLCNDLIEKHDVSERDIMSDVTGGQKTASIAAALATLHRSDLRIQYVRTNDPYDVIAYNVVIQTPFRLN